MIKSAFFQHKVSRQKIYRATLFCSFFLSKFQSQVEESKAHLENWIFKLVGMNPIFLGRARVGLYLSAKLVNEERAGICLMSPLTILDVGNMIGASGLSIEYYDLRKNLFECDVESIEKRIIRGDVSCFVITHYFYIQEDFDKLIDICEKHNVSLIEDCAISLGAKYKNSFSGSFGRFSVFSFSLFKFLNFFWGGVIVCRKSSDHAKILELISSWRSLSYWEYLPQFVKYIKFGSVTYQPIFKFVFQVFKYGLKNNIRLITNNIQNDPIVPFTRQVESSCFTKPHDSFYIELSRKCHTVFSELDMRQQKASFIYNNVSNKNFFALPYNINFNEGTFISLPLIFPSSEYRDLVSVYLLDEGIDCSKQLYRNISSVQGFDVNEGEVNEVKNLIDCCLFIPLHRDVNYSAQIKIINILNKLEF